MLRINLTIQYIPPPLPCAYNILTNIPNRYEGWGGVYELFIPLNSIIQYLRPISSPLSM